jgi:hypothetical protein
MNNFRVSSLGLAEKSPTELAFPLHFLYVFRATQALEVTNARAKTVVFILQKEQR